MRKVPRSNRGMDRFLRARRFLRGQSRGSSFLIARRDAPHSGLSFGSSSASAAARPRAPRSAAARTASPPLLVIDRRSARSARSAGGARRRRASRRLVSCRIGSHGDAGRAEEAGARPRQRGRSASAAALSPATARAVTRAADTSYGGVEPRAEVTLTCLCVTCVRRRWGTRRWTTT